MEHTQGWEKSQYGFSIINIKEEGSGERGGRKDQIIGDFRFPPCRFFFFLTYVLWDCISCAVLFLSAYHPFDTVRINKVLLDFSLE